MSKHVDDFLWKDCVAWLIKINILPAEKVDIEIRILASLLRDGVILCNLLNILDQSLDLKDFNRKPQMAQVRIGFYLNFLLKNPNASETCTCSGIKLGEKIEFLKYSHAPE